MYCSLPFTIPVCVREDLLAALAMPKSTSFTTPSPRTMMFCGLTSRWTMLSGFPRTSLALCAWSSPSAASKQTRTDTWNGRPTPALAAAYHSLERSSPGTYSMAM